MTVFICVGEYSKPMIVGFIILFPSVMDFAVPESAALCCAAAAELHDNWRSCGLPFSTPLPLFLAVHVLIR